jgi:hypothetical protein
VEVTVRRLSFLLSNTGALVATYYACTHVIGKPISTNDVVTDQDKLSAQTMRPTSRNPQQVSAPGYDKQQLVPTPVPSVASIHDAPSNGV